MSFGPCSKKLAENRFWNLSAWGAGAEFQFCARGSAFTDGLLLGQAGAHREINPRRM